MMAKYHFITEWKINASIEEVSDILSDTSSLTRWWPSVYLEVDTLKEGDSDGIGKEVTLFTKGWLPYTLRWNFRVEESNLPKGFKIKAFGDFEGTGIWTFEQEDEYAMVKYDWEINANKFILKYFSWIMKPIFKANHHWAMRKGCKSLELEILRKRANSKEAQEMIEEPPKPTFPHKNYHSKKK